jgi:hypothetical protein
MVRGNVIALILNPAPVTLMEDTTRSAPPVFVTATVFAPLAPTVTFPNDNELGVTVADIVGLPGCWFATPVLPQPTTKIAVAQNIAIEKSCQKSIGLETPCSLTNDPSRLCWTYNLTDKTVAAPD